MNQFIFNLERQLTTAIQKVKSSFLMKFFKVMFMLSRGSKFNILKRFIQTKSIKSLYDSDFLDSNIRVVGWVKSFRNQKEVKFIHISDGTDTRNLQLVISAEYLKQPDEFEKILNLIHFNTSVEVEGKLVKSSHKHQSHELQVLDLKILTQCDPSEYPFKPKVKQTLESIRPYVHLRSHVDQFSSIMKFRSQLVFNIHKFFNDKKFTQIHTPVITSNNCEGGCETFEVKSNEQDHGLEELKSESRHFFSKPVYLTASAQLHLEAMTTGLGNVYTLSPTFRAEKSMTRHHLAEFYMLEAEMIDMNSLDKILDFTEEFLKTVSIETYKSIHESEFNVIFNRNKNSNNRIEYVENIYSYMNEKKFIRIKYSDVIDILNNLLAKKKYAKLTKKKIEFGEDLNKEQEKLLVEYFENVPVFVTNYPKNIKPFYMRQSTDDDGKTVDNFDLLVPNVGEIIGGSLREFRIDLLKNAIVEHNLDPSVFDLYLETKKFGAMKMGGWGLGLERLIQFLINIENIRDCCAFPRYLTNCKM